MISFIATQGLEACRLAASTWKLWPLDLHKPPVIEGTITGGLTNTAFLLSTPHPNYPHLVLRLFSPQTKMYGINRCHEQTIHQLAAEQGISPAILYWDNRLGFSVVEYLPGRTWSQADLESPDKRQALAQIIQRYQQLELTELQPFNYYRHIKNYADRTCALLSKAERLTLKAFLKNLEDWQGCAWPKTLTHHDLSPENIIETGSGLQIIDWEYAGLGHPQFDWLDLPEMDCGFSQCDRKQLEQIRYWFIRLWQML
ncbi:choline/ethanolamine kinase family protein [Halioxenophilus sp. WMMB6]|uniref:choline/ethanolamine kinase family protein n=1 Tax=Halioxenophilus sp. WMMB6 TaxID=3073815 RepID=UPI00295F4250|nr:choline/ethanolamine kinase family protein [Halioxenophilus sp. WMMB6]